MLAFVSLLMACGSSKVIRQAENTLKGNWSLESVTYDRAGTYDITLLGDTSKACFQSSRWQFIPNDYKGNYSIINATCNTGNRYFKFDIQEVDATTGLYDFLLKPTNDKYKSDTNKGFRLKLTQLSDTNMQWQQSVSVEGKPFVINMNFTKLQ
ncbi:lipocalin-like protein [Jejuia pallidilutea]|uniref:Lipocalin-like protein n=2 Tax=Jejuia pallidilutea TaxID=504487 RepID=A0A362X151_9FLAO|nr:lipocalin-like protein [Jejuia pallidilutea]